MAHTENTPGILIITGDVPDNSVALGFARDLVAQKEGHIVGVTVLTNAGEASVQREGPPTTITVDPVPRSNN